MLAVPLTWRIGEVEGLYPEPAAVKEDVLLSLIEVDTLPALVMFAPVVDVLLERFGSAAPGLADPELIPAPLPRKDPEVVLKPAEDGISMDVPARLS